MQCVDKKFQQLKPLDKGGITYLKLLLDEMFCMTNDVGTALESSLKAFADEVLTKTVGENVSESSSQVKAVSEHLSEANQLTLKAPT